MSDNIASLNGVSSTTPEGLRCILESVSDGLLIVDSAGMVIFANASACTMFRHDDLVGTQLGLPVVPDGGYADIHILRKNSMGWAEMRAEPIAWDGIAAHLLSVHDVTERHVYEQRLSLAAKVYESSREGILITDAEANIILVNATFTRLTGYTADEVIGKNPRLLKSNLQDAAFFQAMWDAITIHGVWQGEIWNRRKDGTIFPELLSISTTASSSGQSQCYVGIFSDLSEQKSITSNLERLSTYDALTGLLNRGTFSGLAEQYIHNADGFNGRLALVLINIDSMRAINDQYGVGVGDRVLNESGARLKRAVKEGSFVARMGSDEFGVLLAGFEDTVAPALIARSLLEALEIPIDIDGLRVRITATIGMSLYPDDGGNLQTLLAAADSALDQGKKSGRSHVNLSNFDLNQRAQRAMTIKRLLRQAMERKELEVYYQPQVDGSTCQVVSVEALLRWHCAEMGDVAPSEFIPIAEQTGLIVPIGRWVMNEACRTLAAWHQEGLPKIGMAVNVSVIQLLKDDVPALVAKALDDFQLDKSHLEIEITESAMLDMESCAVSALKQLQASGIKLAVDDFGTGYSSLSMLNTMHLDRLKIDQSFVQDVATKPRSAAIARATISMAKNLNMICIAEGVETEAQMQFLRQENCELLQGYLFSRPLPAEEMKALLQADNKFCALATPRVVD